MELQKLTKGQKVYINLGYAIDEGIVSGVTKKCVMIEGHAMGRHRDDCYAIPGELDRLVSDTQWLAEYAKLLADKARGI
mgnify:CR=1 FL=1